MTFHLRPLVVNPQFEFVEENCWVADGTNVCYKDQTINSPVGATIAISARVRNIGTGAGAPTVKVLQGTTVKCQPTGASLPPGEFEDIQVGSCFTMPNSNVDLVMKVYYGTIEHDSIGTSKLRRRK